MEGLRQNQSREGFSDQVRAALQRADESVQQFLDCFLWGAIKNSPALPASPAVCRLRGKRARKPTDQPEHRRVPARIITLVLPFNAKLTIAGIGVRSLGVDSA
jgi:hypothetical protein